MQAKQLVTFGASVLLAALLLAPPVQAHELRADLSVQGQVRDGDFTRETEAPHQLYGDMGFAGPYDSSVDTFFRLGRDFGTDDGVSDFYAGYLRAPLGLPALHATVGRQFLNEGPGGVFVADAGKLHVDPGWPVSLTLFGGRPQYFEPTVSTNILSSDETIFGGSLRTTRLSGGQLSLGYLQLERDDKVLRQLITGTASHGFRRLPGSPSFYGSVAYDADRQNLDLATAGVNLLCARSRLQLNFEGSYYQPQDDQEDRPNPDLDRREAPIFELFSISEMVQWRGALRYPLGRTLFAFGDYSYQHYDQQEEGPDEVQNSHVASAGLIWLPGGDGLEVVRLEYYVIDTEDDNVNGGKAYYENRVYERLFFRAKIDVTYYETGGNQSDTAISGMTGIGFVVFPGLTWEFNFEANHNDRFDEDFRFGFAINYNVRHRFQPGRTAGGMS